MNNFEILSKKSILSLFWALFPPKRAKRDFSRKIGLRKPFSFSFKVTPRFIAPLLEPHTPQGQSRACLGKSGHAHGESSTIIVFPWYYIIIQKIIPNGQTVLEIIKFEKSSNLIGRELSTKITREPDFSQTWDWCH